MKLSLAPIIVTVYTRLSHFKKCIDALKNNSLAIESALYIFSDAPSIAEHQGLVADIRAYARTITGFKAINLIERTTNLGAAHNAELAIRDTIKAFGRTIVMEDDIITAPGFLAFMNNALDFYKDEEKVISITGYCPPITTPHDFTDDAFCLNRFSGWGSGLYERTLDAVYTKIETEEFDTISNKSIFTNNGKDVLDMIKLEMNGSIDAPDVRCMYQQALYNMLTIYPRRSLVQNIGHDGSGIHCGVTKRFHHHELWDKTDGFEFDKDIQVDERIRKENCYFRDNP